MKSRRPRHAACTRVEIIHNIGITGRFYALITLAILLGLFVHSVKKLIEQIPNRI